MAESTHSRSFQPCRQWVHLAIAYGLLLAACTLDAVRPFSKTFSIFYLAPVMYAGWALRGRAELTVYPIALAAALAVPVLRSLGSGSSLPGFNRGIGAAVGFLVIVLMRERRRYADALLLAKMELEDKVKQRTAELERLNAEYQRVIAVKDQFLSNMSHEIRTPLNGILGMADLLADGAPADDRIAIVRDLRTSGQVLRTIVDDLLDLTRMEANSLEIREAPFSLRATVAEVVALVRIEASRSGVEVISNVPEESFDRVMGDQVRIRQILTNLAGNALKFTARGTIWISVQAMEAVPGDDAVRFRFEVRDTGIGIPKHAQARIFDKFTQIDASAARRYGGSGLGLAICKNLVGLMHGEIGVESAVGEGATFWFTLRLHLASADLETAAGAEPTDGLPAWVGLRAAIVEDNAINRRLMLRLLEKLGFVVEPFSSGKELLETATAASFDIVFMDIQMPEMDGLETTRALRLRESATAPRTLVVAVTASVLEHERDACFAAGMDDFLAKPVSMAELRRTLSEWTPTRTAPVQPAAPATGIRLG